MSKKLGMLALMLISTLGTGCRCWFDQCGNYNQCGGAYDPCTGLVYNQYDPYQGCRSKRIRKKLDKDRCDCRRGTRRSSGCADCQSYDEPIYGEPIYGEPVHGEPVETYYEPESYPELMVPHEVQPSKPVPAPPAEEPKQLPMPQGSSIPPASYEVPAPLEGPDVPVLQPYQGR